MLRGLGRKCELKFWRRRKRGLLSRSLGSLWPGGSGRKRVLEGSVLESMGKGEVSVLRRLVSAER